MSDRHFRGPLTDLLFGPPHETTPDPWPSEVDEAVRRRDAVPLCVNCLSPHGHHWFCPHCGFPGGEYVTVMPYLHVFATGEALRRGVLGPPENNLPQTAMLVLFSAANYGPFAPLYWFWMSRKAAGRPICEIHRRELPSEPASDLEER